MPVEKRRKKSLPPPSWRPKSPPTTNPSLRFTPAAWAKLLFWRDLGGTEVGGFGISAAADPLLIEDVRLVRQTCSVVTVKFDDASVADLFDEQVDLGRMPEQFSRVWIHTHPGQSPQPSHVDEQTFERVFGMFHWSVMFIVARGGETYARLQFRVGPGGTWEIPVTVDYTQPFPATDHDGWRRDYETLIETKPEWELDDDFVDDFPSAERPFDLNPWEDAYDEPFGLGSLRSAEWFGADGPFADGLGDRDRRRRDRSPSRPATHGLGGGEAATDRSG